jgi:TfoX/Sxy family transcriptional regulator of competence genes
VPFDEGLAQRVRELLDEQAGLVEKKMFGGLAFLVNGNMAVGVVKSELMVRVGADAYPAALREPGARPMDFTKRPMKGFVFVAESGCEDDRALARWVERGVQFAAALPPKRPPGGATPRAPSSSAPPRSRA